MFDLSLIKWSTTVRGSPGQWLAEGIATFGLVLTILGCIKTDRRAVPYAVGLFVGAAYWLTSSTSFAIPAVTVARAFTDTFAGIAPEYIPSYILFQILGAIVVFIVSILFWPKPEFANG